MRRQDTSPLRPDVDQNRTSEPNSEEISKLAYQLWQDRGYPIGSPDEDWLRAEEILQEQGTASPGTRL